MLFDPRRYLGKTSECQLNSEMHPSEGSGGAKRAKRANQPEPFSTNSTFSTAPEPLAGTLLAAEDCALRFEEIAGILEYDEGLPRTEAERLARLRVCEGVR